MTVRLMTWNVKTGGVDRGRGDRLDAILAVINRVRLDIVALQELRDFDRHDGRRMNDVAAAVGLTAHLAGSVFGQPVAVLVRPPLVITSRGSVRWRLHHTDHTAELTRLDARYRRRHLGPDGTADTRALAAFAAGGLTDLWPPAGRGDGHTAPTTNGGGHEFSGMRLDYVLASPLVAAAARSARVVRGDEAEYASDHYPVVVDLALGGQN
jgi:exodeoxyribonuclease III